MVGFCRYTHPWFHEVRDQVCQQRLLLRLPWPLHGPWAKSCVADGFYLFIRSIRYSYRRTSPRIDQHVSRRLSPRPLAATSSCCTSSKFFLIFEPKVSTVRSSFHNVVVFRLASSTVPLEVCQSFICSSSQSNVENCVSLHVHQPQAARIGYLGNVWLILIEFL